MATSVTIKYTDPTSDPRKQTFTIMPGETDSTTTSLSFPGQGAADYSSKINTDLLHLLENFASANPPLHGTVGQLWFSTSARELRVLSSIGTAGDGSRLDNWIPVAANISYTTTPPTDTSRLWYDTSAALAANHQLKIYNTSAAAWQPVTKQYLVVSATAPANTTILWYNISNADATKHELYVYNTTRAGWFPVISHDAGMLTGSVPNSVLTSSSIGGNAATATLAATATVAVQLQTSRTISLTGGATATGTFDGSANLALNVTSLNATSLLTGTVPVARIGDSGTRSAAYYLAGNNVWTQFPSIPDAYTKTQTDALVNTRALRDAITYVGLASNNPANPYMRRESDNSIVYLQPALGYSPAPRATTLAGYGITDAYTQAQVNALIVPGPETANDGNGNGWIRWPGTNFTIQWGTGPALSDDQSTIITLFRPGFLLNVQVTLMGTFDGTTGPGAPLTDSYTSTSFRVSQNWTSSKSKSYPFKWVAITFT